MADQFIQTSTHFEEDKYRHWSPESQTYAPADVLMHYLRSGWHLEPLAAVETFYNAGHRRVDVYYFTLRYGDKITEMPVLMNPRITRLIEEQRLTVLRINSAHGDLD